MSLHIFEIFFDSLICYAFKKLYIYTPQNNFCLLTTTQFPENIQNQTVSKILDTPIQKQGIWAINAII